MINTFNSIILLYNTIIKILDFFFNKLIYFFSLFVTIKIQKLSYYSLNFMLDQLEKDLTERNLKNLLDWTYRFVKYNKDLYFKVATSKFKKRYISYLIISHLIITSYIVSIFFDSFFGFYFNTLSSLLKFIITILFIIPILMHFKIKSTMNNKSLFDIYSLNKKADDLVLVKLKTLMESDFIQSFSNYKKLILIQNKMVRIVRSMYGLNKRIVHKLLKINLYIFSLELLISVIGLVQPFSNIWAIDIVLLIYIGFYFFYLNFKKSIVEKKIEYEIHIDRFLIFIKKVIEDGTFPADYAREHLHHYIYNDFKKFNIKVACKVCHKLIRLKSISQESAYCSKCNKEFKIENTLLYIASFKIISQCIICGYKTSIILRSPFEKHIQCKKCGYDRGILYPPIIFNILYNFLGESQNIGIMITPHGYNEANYHFILLYDGEEKVLIPIPYEFSFCQLIFIPLEFFLDLSYNFQNKYEWVKNSISEGNELLLQPSIISEPNQQEKYIDNFKGKLLEVDIRNLYRKKNGYDIKLNSHDVHLSIEDRKLLNTENCLKDMQTKTKDIDIFGYKEERATLTYIIGETKFKNRELNLSEFKNFVIVADILARQIITNNEKHQKNIRFHLIVVSHGGFSKEWYIPDILSSFWNHGLDRIKGEKVELIGFEEIIRLFRQYNITTAPYTLRI